jgi:hypothetical protein
MQHTTQQIAKITTTRANWAPDPLHPGTDEPKRVRALVADMEHRGWVGPPIVILSDVQALTGSHRIPAAIEADVPIPHVLVEELCEEYDLNWAALRATYHDDWYQAAAALRDLLPRDVVEYLGYDVDGPC